MEVKLSWNTTAIIKVDGADGTYIATKEPEYGVRDAIFKLSDITTPAGDLTCTVLDTNIEDMQVV